MVLYFRFLLLSFSLICHACVYGGFPITTNISAAFCFAQPALYFRCVKSSPCSFSSSSNVSASAIPSNGRYVPCALEELLLNVQTGDIVRQEHHLVTVQLVAIFLFQRRALDVLHQPNNEVARPDERIDDMHTAIRQRPTELGF